MASVALLSPTLAHKSVYEKWPLERGKKQIRLLEIQPGSADDPVEMDVSIADLDAKPPKCYTALSYRWIKEGVKGAVLVDGQRMEISETLHHALVHIRAPATVVVIWIDYICIDQNSTKEKNHQVPLMGKV